MSYLFTQSSYTNSPSRILDKMASLGTLKRLFSAQAVRRMATNAAQGDFKKHLIEEESHAGGKGDYSRLNIESFTSI